MASKNAIAQNIIGRKAKPPTVYHEHPEAIHNDAIGEIIAAWVEDTKLVVTLLFDDGTSTTWLLGYCTVLPRQ